ncbi:MAG: tyrosinase family protein [Thermoanaerobaculia bacterium]
MTVSRRFVIRQVTIGSLALTFGFDVESLWAAECGKPVSPDDCTLPTPPPATRFIPNEPNVRTRYSALEMADPSRATQLQQFRDAICLVRNLPPTDVISWTKFIAQHCINCARSNSSNIHYDWQFLPWHRALLYFLERVLRNQSGNDDVRLVYWDWENASSRTLPAIYAPADQPLYWANRGDLQGRNWPLRYDDVNVQPLLAIPDFKTFGGSSVQKDPVPAAYSGPHANVHNNFSPGDMSNLQYSPRDPVFYAHHGNIDRLWSSWVAAGHSNPDFGDAKVYFYDENRQWRFVLMNDLRDTRTLGYEYSSLMQPRVSTRSLRTMSVSRDANRIALGAQTMRALNAPAPEFLVMTNIDLDALPADTLRFGIFAGKPPVGTASGSTNTFLGKASRVLSEGHAHAEPLSAALDISNKLGSLDADGGAAALDLHVAPLDESRTTTGEAIPVAADSIRIVG